MALRFIDGFDYYWYGDNYYAISLANGWFNGPEHTYPCPPEETAFGYGFGITMGGTTNNTQYRARSARRRYTKGPNDDRTVYVWGQRMRVPPGTSAMSFGVADSFARDFGEQWNVVVDYTGSVTLRLGSNRNILQAKTLSGAFAAGQWFYIEIKWTISNTADAFFEVRINTVPVLSITTAITAVGNGLILPATELGFDIFYYNCNSDARPWAIDDFYMLDSTGPINNDYLGNVRVKMQAVTGQTETDWEIGGTQPAATNWQSVLNRALNDTKFVRSDLVGAQDLYSVDPNINAPFIHGFEVMGAYRQDDATQRVVRNTYRTAIGTVVYGENNYTNQSYTFKSDVYEINPDTGQEFTQAELNTLTIGPNLVQ